MGDIVSSGHVLPIEDDKFRLTFVSTCPGRATFNTEIGDMAEWQVQEWLRDHLHPQTKFDSLFRSLASRSEFTVPVGQMLMTCHWDEDGGLVKSPSTVEQVCQWLAEYQKLYFDDLELTISVVLLKNSELKGTAGFCPSYPRMGSILLSSELLEFNCAMRISILHELIHANLFVEKGDPDGAHGERFKAEVKRLVALGVYDSLV